MEEKKNNGGMGVLELTLGLHGLSVWLLCCMEVGKASDLVWFRFLFVYSEYTDCFLTPQWGFARLVDSDFVIGKRVILRDLGVCLCNQKIFSLLLHVHECAIIFF